jgi:hypothetical protein
MKKLVFGIIMFSFIFQSCENNTNDKVHANVTTPNENVNPSLNESETASVPEPEQALIQPITDEETDKKFPFATATEGLNISVNKNGYDKNEFIVLNYAGKAYLKINNEIISLKEASFKNQKVGFIEVFKNNKYKLVINATNVNEIRNAPIEGLSNIEGNITLFDAEGNTLQNIPTFYAEGFY